jgi:hypothetical protein
MYFNKFNSFIFLDFFIYFYDNIRCLQNRASILKKYLFEIVITLWKVEKNKPRIPFFNQPNIEKEWNKKIRKIKRPKTKKKNI